jgi:hypothetical protein
MVWQKTGARLGISSVKKFGIWFAPEKAKPAPVSDTSIILQDRALSRSSAMPGFRTRLRGATRLSIPQSVAAGCEQIATNFRRSGASTLTLR